MVKHRPECTWRREINTPPKEFSWGSLNYVWCHAFCDWPSTQRDVVTIYEAGHGKAPMWWNSKRYFKHWEQHLPCCFPKHEGAHAVGEGVRNK